jgi:hypothetical protein
VVRANKGAAKMREQFKKLPDVHKKLKDLHPTIVWFCDQENKYASSFDGFQNMVLWLNGAYYAYQEQQKKIDAIVECVKSNTADYDLDNKIKDILK